MRATHLAGEGSVSRENRQNKPCVGVHPVRHTQQIGDVLKSSANRAESGETCAYTPRNKHVQIKWRLAHDGLAPPGQKRSSLAPMQVLLSKSSMEETTPMVRLRCAPTAADPLARPAPEETSSNPSCFWRLARLQLSPCGTSLHIVMNLEAWLVHYVPPDHKLT